MTLTAFERNNQSVLRASIRPANKFQVGPTNNCE